MTALDLASLNEPQREAVEHGDGPLLVFAGAGSGKTRVLTYRLAHLIHSGRALPSQLLAVTFTNKAAGEMKERVAALLGGEARGAWVHTFHSACLRILRREAPHVGLEHSFVIYDEGDQKRLLKDILKEVDRTGRVGVGLVRSRIEEAKRRRVPPEEMSSGARFGGAVKEAYAQYQKRLRASQAVDFTDLLALTAELFDEHPQVLDRYRDRFRYLLVDEFQDTDDLQYDLVKQLAAPRNNLCVVGDDDQSIYSFRGADVGNIRGFEADFTGARVVRLEQNYRSTTAILDAAGRVVNAGGGGGSSKELWTDRGDGEPPTVLQARDEADEARKVVGVVRQEMGRGVTADRMAVLYRTNAQSRALEEAFQRSNIPFVLVGGTRFYERREIKEALSWLRLLIQPRDLVSFARAVRAPTRGIGAGTVGKVVTLAVATGATAEEAARRAAAERLVGPAIGKRLVGFCDTMADIRGEAAALTLPDLMELVLQRSGLAESYSSNDSHEAQQRFENLLELIRSAAERSEGVGLDALAEFMDRAALVSDSDSLPAGTGTDEASDAARISLMTIHCAKGLEFGVVCIVGLDEGLFPNSRASTSQRGLEEEYRLCYVACTRAMDRLYLLRAQRRLMVFDRAGGGAGWRQTQASPFLRYLRGNSASSSLTSLAAPSAGFEVEDDPDSSEVVYDPEEVSLRIGTRVRHPAFGVGEVRRIEGRGPTLKLQVFFPRAGMKKLSARHARLEIIGL
jgi:DNA helicase II / ATP-dependent DNA helicase PcrA